MKETEAERVHVFQTVSTILRLQEIDCARSAKFLTGIATYYVSWLHLI